MNENYNLGKVIARRFNKKNGIITYSGTLAIEIAIASLNLKENTKILVNSQACYSIINTIIKLKYIPVLIETTNKYTLTDFDIDNALSKYDIGCILLVHQYGILNDINFEKYKKMGIKIIEDAAQLWIPNNNHIIGNKSDIIVTSFGKTKPLSYGIGGGLFFDNKSIMEYVDYCDIKSRENKNVLMSYLYPLCGKINYKNLIKTGNKNVNEQKRNAKAYIKLFSKYDFIMHLNEDDTNSWHRFPIWLEDKKLYNKLINEIKKTALEYQLPHKIDTLDLKRNSKCIKIKLQRKEMYEVLLRTRKINTIKQIKILKKIMDNLI